MGASTREPVLGSQCWGARELSAREHVALPRDFSIEDILSREEGIPYRDVRACS